MIDCCWFHWQVQGTKGEATEPPGAPHVLQWGPPLWSRNSVPWTMSVARVRRPQPQAAKSTHTRCACHSTALSVFSSQFTMLLFSSHPYERMPCLCNHGQALARNNHGLTLGKAACQGSGKGAPSPHTVPGAPHTSSVERQSTKTPCNLL